MAVSFENGLVKITDYFHAETIADFPVISLEECELPICLKWMPDEDSR